MIGAYLPHSFVFSRNLSAEDFDILSKLCSGGMPLAVIRDCLPVLLDSEHCNWVVSTLEVLLLSHLPAYHEKHFPDSWNGVWAFAGLLTAMKHHLTSSLSRFCWIFAFSSLYRVSAVQKFRSRQDVTQQRWESLRPTCRLTQLPLRSVPWFSDSSHSSENSVFAVAMNIILL